MAIYHLSVKTISRSAGRSATAAAAYRAGVKITEERTGEIHNYTRKGGVESAELVLPDGAPAWAHDRAALWNAAEQAETRKNSTVAREFEIALPSELSPAERQRLALDLAREIVERHGCAADVAIHAPGREGDNRNHHAHILLSTRRLCPQGFTEKTRELDDQKTGKELVTQWRERFASLQNERLRHAGIAVRVDHRTLEAQGIEREPTRHLGPSATGYERRTGQPSDKRIQQEQEAAERLARAKALGELERQGKAIDRSIIDLSGDLEAAKAERDRLERQRRDEAQRQADPAETLRAWLTQPPIALRGSTEGLSRQSVLENVATCQDSGTPPAGLLGEAERVALRQAGWLDARDDLTPKGLGAVQHHIQQAAERQRREEATRKAEQERLRQAALERQRRDEAQRLAAERQQEQEQEQERLNAQTAAGSFDGIRAPRRTPADWQQWRARVLTQAYGDQVEVAALARTWRVQRAKGGQPLTLQGTGGQSIEDYGDRICPSGDDRRGAALQDATLRTALQLAQLKGWGQPGAGLDITGSSAFRERAARQAVRLGMTVANADLQAIVADERQRLAAERAPAPPVRAEPPAQQHPHPAERLAAFPTDTVDRSALHAAKPAPAREQAAVPENQAEAPSGPFAAAVQMMEQSLDRWLDGDRSSGPVKAFITAHDRATRQGANGRTLIAEVVDRVVTRRGEGAGVSADLGGFLAAIERQRKRELGMGR